MDGNWFDAFSRRLAHRRSVLAVLAAGGLSALPVSDLAGEAAGRCPLPCPLCRRCKQGKCKKQKDGTPCVGGTCRSGVCQAACQPNCAGKACGSDGCGASCGACPTGTTCQNGACQSSCTPQCVGKTCGADSCGGSCGSCPTGMSCQNGTCVHDTARCDPSYPDVCIPSPPPDLDCRDIPYRNFRVVPPDPHGFDADHDGIGCEGA